MQKFAKLFESEKYGQILAMLGDSDDTGEPQIRFYCQPGDHVGLCHVGTTYSDTDDGLARREKSFDKLDLAMAENAASEVFKIADEMRANGLNELTE